MFLSHIVAHGLHFEIGKDNALLWHYSEDLKYFKEQTKNKVLIMGRKTFESILDFNKKPLIGRFHIILSQQSAPENSLYENVRYVHTVEEAYALADSLTNSDWPEEVMIIGGASIYKQTLPHCQKLYITKVNRSFTDADTFYPNNYNSTFKLETETASTAAPELSYSVWVK